MTATEASAAMAAEVPVGEPAFADAPIDLSAYTPEELEQLERALAEAKG